MFIFRNICNVREEKGRTQVKENVKRKETNNARKGRKIYK